MNKKPFTGIYLSCHTYRNADDARGDANNNTDQSQHRARDSERRSPEREARNTEHKHDRQHRRLSRGGTDVIKRIEAGGAERGGQNNVFGNPRTEV